VIVEGAVKKWGAAIERIDTPAVLAGITGAQLDLGATDAGGGRHAQLWPHRHGTDAMFIQLIGKV
jgi:16S rRNA (cytosine967-C5)-methyltransferase